MVLIRAQTAITFWQTAVTVYFSSTQLLPFAFARQRIGGDNLMMYERALQKKTLFSRITH